MVRLVRSQGRDQFAFFLSSRLGETERAIELLHDAQEQGLIHPGCKHFSRLASVPLDSSPFSEFLEQYEADERRLREMY